MASKKLGNKAIFDPIRFTTRTFIWSILFFLMLSFIIHQIYSPKLNFGFEEVFEEVKIKGKFTNLNPKNLQYRKQLNFNIRKNLSKYFSYDKQTFSFYWTEEKAKKQQG